MTHTGTVAYILLASSALLVGCGNRDHELALASTQSAIQSSRNTNIGSTTRVQQKDDACLDPTEAAAETAARPSVGLYPQDCDTKTSEGSELHVEYDDCTGAFGKVHIRGGVDAKFSESACDKLHAEIADSGDLTGNDKPVEYSASAEIRVDGTLRRVDYAGHWSSTTEWGVDVDYGADLDVVVDTETNCLDVAGTGRGKWGDYDFSTKAEGFKICPDACPAAGKVSVFAEGVAKDSSLLIEFDGSAKAKVTGTDGDQFEVNMVCDGGEEPKRGS